jgi:hypothetical protein
VGATPDHSVKVCEQFFGSSESGYAVLRTEDDNCGSYYRSEISTWLDEYSAEDPSRKQARRTLLLKVSSNRNPDDHHAPPVMQVLEEESTMMIASLIKKYPVRALEAWTQEQMSKMQLHPKAGIHFRNRVFIIDGAVIDKEVFEGRPSDSEWRMDGVSHDAKMVFVQVSAGNDEGPQTRLIGVPLKVSKIVKDQLGMEALYLVSDRCDAKEAAVSRARELGRLAREKSLFAFQPEVWSTRLPTDKMAYLVTTANSEQLIRSGSVKRLEDGLGIDFEPVSSEGFEERIPLDEESGDR